MSESSLIKKRWAGNVGALVLLGVLLYRANLSELFGAFQNLTVSTIALLMLLSVLLVYVSALKWSYFVEHFGTRISVLHLFNLYLVGYFINLVIPSYIGGDALRSWYAGKKAGQHQAFAATILERYTGFVAMLILALVFVWMAPVVTLPVKLLVVAMALGLVTLTLVSLSPLAIKTARKLPKSSVWIGHLERLQQSIGSIRGEKVLLCKALFLSFGFHSLTIINTYVAAYAVGWHDANFTDLFVVVPLILLIGAIPVTPGGLGLQEGAFFVFLQGIGASGAEALGVGILLRAKSYILALVGGVIWLFIRARKNEISDFENGSRQRAS